MALVCKCKVKMIEKFIFFCLVYISNLVSHPHGRTWIIGVWEQGLRRLFGPKRPEVTEL
jgi:hypothetical protein